MTADYKEVYKKWIFEGLCPCCFPYWQYPAVSVNDMISWQDEFQAWEVYDEILGEYDED